MDAREYFREMRERDPEFRKAVEDSQPIADLARLLIRYRIETGASQAQLAQLLGVSRRLLNRIQMLDDVPLDTINQVAERLSRILGRNEACALDTAFTAH